VGNFDSQVAIRAQTHHEHRHRKLTDQQIDQETAKGKNALTAPLHTEESYHSQGLHHLQAATSSPAQESIKN
jgi:hypothetical protein